MYRPADAEDPRETRLSDAQYEAARLGFFQFLRRKRMSPPFIERHGEELFQQACLEHTRQCSEGKVIFDPPAWIVTCGWNRTKSLLETRDYRPEMVSADLLGDLPAEGDTPEDEVLEEDRLRKIHEAVDQLPLYQRRLLALSYFEEESVREAARRLHWTASKGQRAHENARKRLYELLGVESLDELEVDIGAAAFFSVAAAHAGGPVQIGAGAEGAAESFTRHASHLGERVTGLIRVPFEAASHPTRLLGRSGAAAVDRAGEIGRRGPLRRVADLGRRLFTGGPGEAAGALAGEGGTRALEVCKGLTVCVIGGTALTGALASGGHHPAHPVDHASRHERVVRAASPEPARAPAGDTAPVEPRPRLTPGPSASTGPAESSAPISKTPKVEAAEPVEETAVARDVGEEGEAETQFRDFAATEGSTDPTATAQSRSVTASATTADGAGTSSAANPQGKAKEAQAAQEFHGLLE